MKALWLVSFRPIGKSKLNDFYQSLFVDSVKSTNFDITFSLTQFNEENVEEFINKKNIKNFFVIHLKSDVHKIIKLKKKMKIYKKKKNILGIDIKPEFPQNPHVTIENNFNNSLNNVSMDLIEKINKIV